MAHNVFRGIPALASPSVNVGSFSCPCSLVVKVNVAYRQASIMLRFQLPLQGFDTDQQISLVYDGNILEAGAADISNTILYQDIQKRQISRHGKGTDARSLHLVLKRPCIVLGPGSSECYAPKDGSDVEHFRRVVTLAKVTMVNIVFDYAWLHPSKSAQLHSITSDTTNWVGFPRTHRKKSLTTEGDWSLFVPTELARFEAPRSYPNASLKRFKLSQAAPTSPPQGPKAEHISLQHAQDIDAASETEVTATTATPSPQLLPSSPLNGPFDIQRAVENAVAKLLPNAFEDALPDAINKLLAVPTLSLSPRSSPAPPKSLHEMILDKLKEHADDLAAVLTAERDKHAEELREEAQVKLYEQLADHRLQYADLKEEGIQEIGGICDKKEQKLKDYAKELRDDMESEADDALTKAKEKIDKFVKKKTIAFYKDILTMRSKQQARAKPLPVGSNR